MRNFFLKKTNKDILQNQKIPKAKEKKNANLRNGARSKYKLEATCEKIFILQVHSNTRWQ